MSLLNHLAYNIFSDRLDDVPAVTLSACQRFHKMPGLFCGNFTRHRRLVGIDHSLHDGWTRIGERFTQYRLCLFRMLDDALAAVGADRLLWGADITLETGLAKLRALEVIGLSTTDMESVRWRNAVRIFPRGSFPVVEAS